MATKRLAYAILLGCAVLIVAGPTKAQDWPQWRGPHRQGKATGFNAPQEWPKELTRKWQTKVGLGCSTPALVDGKLYVFARQGDEEATLCLDATNGKELWKDHYAAQAVTGAASRFPGPRSSPTVTDGKVVTLGVGGVLSCLEAGSGKVLWRKDPFPKAVPRFFASYSPIVVDGMVIAHLGGGDNAAMIAYDLASGQEKWRWTGQGPDYGSPVQLTVSGVKQIVSPTDQGVVGVAVSDGKELWQLPFPPERRAYNAATAIVDGQMVIYSGAGRGTKEIKLTKQGDGFAVGEVWTHPDLGVQYNTPVLKDGLLYGLSDRNVLFAIDAEAGGTAWTHSDDAFGSRGFGSVVDAGSCLVILANSSELVVFKPDGKKYIEVARYKVADTEVYAYPVLTDKRIFVKDQEMVTLWTVE